MKILFKNHFIYHPRPGWKVDETLTNPATPGQSGRIIPNFIYIFPDYIIKNNNLLRYQTPHSSELRKWSLTTGRSLVSCPGQQFKSPDEPGSNGNVCVNSYSLEFQYWNLNTGYSLPLYPGH